VLLNRLLDIQKPVTRGSIPELQRWCDMIPARSWLCEISLSVNEAGQPFWRVKLGNIGTASVSYVPVHTHTLLRRSYRVRTSCQNR
jgi:hypothetical protein